MSEHKPEIGSRIGAMLLDHIIMSMVAIAFTFPGMISQFSNAFTVNHEPFNADFIDGFNAFSLIGFALYFCKDSIRGRSIAKRIIKLQVVENKSGRVASPLRCFIRNIFCILWPIEVIVTLINPSRRIGDIVAGTKVIDFDPELEQPKINYLQIGLSIILSVGLVTLIMLPVQRMMQGMEKGRVTYVEESLNEQSANKTEQLYIDSLGAYLTPDVRVYDQIDQTENIKYVSVILYLKSNYLDHDDDFKILESYTEPILFSQYPEKTFVGQIIYVYEQPGSIQKRITPFDWRKTENNRRE